AVRRVKKIGNAHIFEPVVTRKAAARRIVDDLLAFFGGSPRTLMAQLVEAGRLTLDDLREAELTLERLEAERRAAGGGEGEAGGEVVRGKGRERGRR
ncbi:MAG TPA: BlaI/MecI/CopY family transcriptional regulator, partial [Pyrinomonadaceae bacterium]|nr:BlaI/MecI/CopY family transcriptional regulator [Pyrinomonadaceae bacterium]